MLHYILVTPKRLLWQTVKTQRMLHNVAFHKGLHCLVSQKQSFENELQDYLDIITLGPPIYIMYCHKFFVSNQKEESITKGY